jgi:O-antigen ligase
MSWILGGYMWLFIHRPFEVWDTWGALHVERLYMVFAVLYWLLAARKSWIHNRLNAAFALLALAILAAWRLSPYPELGEASVQAWFQVALFYVLLLSTLRNEGDLQRIVLAYVVAVGLYMTHSLWEYHNGRYQYTMGTSRLLGIDLTFGDPNTFAATILYSLPLAMALWPFARQLWQRGLLAGYGLLSLVCVLLTSSRTGFVGLCCLAAMTALLSTQRLKWLVLLVVLAPAAWHFLPQDRQNRFLTLVDPSYGPANAQVSAEGRAQGWRDGLQLWSEHPLTGVGPGAFGASTGTGFESHQLYGQVLGELGTCGLIAFVCLLAAFAANAWQGWRLCRQNPHLKTELSWAIVRATSQTVVLLLLLGLAGHNLYRYTWLWFGAFQALALQLLKERADTLMAGDEEECADDESRVLEAVSA